MWPVFIVTSDPFIEIFLQLRNRGVELFSEGDAVELVEDCLVQALNAAIIRYVIRGAFLVWLCFSKNSVMVSPSGTRGAGSTKVRAGRR
jgi:hypothetical protein